MKMSQVWFFAVIMAVAAAAGFGLFTAQADTHITTDGIAGTWYGNMHFSNRNSVERIQMVIPSGCEVGEVCGSLMNFSVQCTWALTFTGFVDGQYTYVFSDTLKGSCLAGSQGYVELLEDGSLYRVHTTPMFTAEGKLEQRVSPAH
jgi:hypothetical protein